MKDVFRGDNECVDIGIGVEYIELEIIVGEDFFFCIVDEDFVFGFFDFCYFLYESVVDGLE